MLALVYLIIVFALGDALCRRFFHFVSIPHRLATAFLGGLLISTWFTYLVAWMFGETSQPMVWGNLFFVLTAITTIVVLNRLPIEHPDETGIDDETSGFRKWDWIIVGAFFVFACWLMFSTFTIEHGILKYGHHQSSDYGSTVSIMQSFAVGHNFPTEYPHFSGEPIRYHFLFYFQGGNLEYLGLNPALSNNILSILSLVSMLVLVMTLGTVLFASRAVGRIGAALFFFHGSLAFIPFLIEKGSISDILSTLTTSNAFLSSGFPYRGETWGVWSQVVFLNQRHLASSIGLFLVVLIFIVIRYKRAMAVPAIMPDTNDPAEEIPEFQENGDTGDEDSPISVSTEPQAAGLDVPPAVTPFTLPWFKEVIPGIGPYIFSGILLGLLPLWNGPVFLAAAVVLAILFVSLPLRRSVAVTGIVAGIVALPQIMYLRTGNVWTTVWHWGYTIDDPTIVNVIKYLGFTFGFKWLLIAIAIYFGTRLQRTILGAVSALVAIAFCFQFSSEVLANHKFLNIWLVVANIFVAFGIVRLWGLRFGPTVLPSRILAVILVILIILGGVIDLFPIRNDYWSEVRFHNDQLVGWVKENTDPSAVFLSHRYVNHGILVAGRRLFYGHPYYSWSAGYNVAAREDVYRRMLESQNIEEVFGLLKTNKISYVAIDNFIRDHGDIIKANNEAIYKAYFEVVFDDKDKRYDSLTIYKVPETLGTPKTALPPLAFQTPSPTPEVSVKPGLSMFAGGKGKENGQLDWPRGIAADPKGNIVVADANNGRLQWFTADGDFFTAVGSTGSGEGEFSEPSGVAFDANGDFYVADFRNHRLVKFKADRSIAGNWRGPDDKFSPRDVAVGMDRTVYVADEEGARIVKFGVDGKIIGTFGAKGSGDGQFDQLTSVAVDDKGDRVFAADPRHGRIVVFDRKGTFVGNWLVPEWQDLPNSWFLQDIIVDAKNGRLFASSTQTDEILIFDMAGNKVTSLKPASPNHLEGVSSLLLLKNKLYATNCFGSRITVIDLEKQDLPSTFPK